MNREGEMQCDKREERSVQRKQKTARNCDIWGNTGNYSRTFREIENYLF